MMTLMSETPIQISTVLFHTGRLVKCHSTNFLYGSKLNITNMHQGPEVHHDSYQNLSNIPISFLSDSTDVLWNSVNISRGDLTVMNTS